MNIISTSTRESIDSYSFYSPNSPAPHRGVKGSSLNDSQFAEVKKLIETYLKITALGSVRDMSDKELERNARILDAAGYKQDEIGLILGKAQSTISDVLAGKSKKKLKKGETE